MAISIEQLQALLQQQHQQQLQQLLQQQQQQFERAQIKLIEMFTQKLNMQNPGTDTCGPQASQTNALISSISDFQCDPMAGVTSESCYKKCEDIKDLSQYQRELFEASQSRLIKILEAKLSVQPSQFQFQPNQVCSPEPVFENGKDSGSESTVAAYDEPEFCGRRNLGLNLTDQEPITINDEDEQNPKVDFGERAALPEVTGPEKPTKPMTTPERNLNTINSMFLPTDNTPDEENGDIDHMSLSKKHFDNSADWCTQSYAKLKSDQFVEQALKRRIDQRLRSYCYRKRRRKKTSAGEETDLIPVHLKENHQRNACLAIASEQCSPTCYSDQVPMKTEVTEWKTGSIVNLFS